MSKTCEQCGNVFEPSKYHPNQRFCSGDKCRKKWEAHNQYNPQVCSCRQCGKEFVPKKADRNKYCTNCKGQAPRKNHGRGIEPVFVSVCVTCGKHCKTSYCSDECRRLGEAARARQHYSANRPLLSPRLCKECTVQFVPEHGNQQSYCSDECAKKYNSRISKAARRARMRNVAREAIDPLAVFERDGWKCHICGQKTPKRLRGTIEDNAPELDHIIPLAQGGTHTWDNVACSCRKCNGLKGSQIVGQQLLPVFAGI